MLHEIDSPHRSNSTSPSSAVLITDPNDCLVYVSPNAEEVFGVHFGDTFFFDKVLEQFKSKGPDEPAESEIPLTKDRTIVLLDRDGQALVLIADVHEIALNGCHRLITIRQADESTRERGLAETAKLVAENQEYYRTVADSAPVSIAVMKAGRFIYVNHAWERLTGYTSAESRTLNPFSMIHPTMRDMMLQRRKDESAGKTVPDRYDLIIIDKQKQERWIDLSMIRMTGKGDRSVFSFAIDITEIKRAEFALKHSENQMRHLLDSTFEAIVGVDQDGLCTFINQAGVELLGYENGDDLIGKNVHELYHYSNPDGSFLAESQCPQWTALKTGKPLHDSDAVFWRKDGSSFPVSCRFQPFDVDNVPSGGVVTFLDISVQINTNQEKQRLEQQLHHYQKMEAIGTMAGGIAHDFNNILSGIIGYGELMEIFEITSREEMREKVGRILRAAYRARELVKQILTFSRKMEVEFKEVNLIPLIREILILVRASFPSRINIETFFTVENDTIFADSTQIHQVLLNLCTNGADSMKEEGGTLSIRLSSSDGKNINGIHADEQLQGSWLLLEVQDTGCGISPKIADRIFEPYFTTKKVGEGTGLGLATVYGIVKSLNGHIFVESEPGVGSSFRLYFPLCAPQKGQSAIADTFAELKHRGRILFVDDESDIVNVSKEFLCKLGYSVTATTSSREALECFETSPSSFDLIITDEAMSGISGLDLALKVREIKTDITIILCTGNSAAVSHEKAKAAGILQVLRKPVSLKTLAACIEKTLG